MPADTADRRWLDRRARREDALQLELDVTDDVAIGGVGITRIVHGEGIEGIAVPRGVDFGVEDRQPRITEEAADAREQLLLIRQIDHHLQPDAGARQPRFDQRFLPFDAEVELARMPRDLVGTVALEVHAVELAP